MWRPWTTGSSPVVTNYSYAGPTSSLPGLTRQPIVVADVHVVPWTTGSNPVVTDEYYAVPTSSVPGPTRQSIVVAGVHVAPMDHRVEPGGDGLTLCRSHVVIAGLDPAIHRCHRCACGAMDHRVEPGGDGLIL